MLSEISAHATLPVSDLDRARDFYENVLGLEEVGERDGGRAILFQTGATHIVLYRSEYAGTNKATVLLWEADDPEVLVEELKERGVTFEHYPGLSGVTVEGDLHHSGPLIEAWFKDPDGNIHCIGSTW